MVGYTTDNRSIQVQFLVPGPNIRKHGVKVSQEIANLSYINYVVQVRFLLFPPYTLVTQVDRVTVF